MFNNLFSHVHLVSFKRGKIELNPTDDAPKDLGAKIGQLLTEWTKEKWHILMTQEKGDPTLEEQSDKEKIESAIAKLNSSTIQVNQTEQLILELAEQVIDEGDTAINELVAYHSNLKRQKLRQLYREIHRASGKDRVKFEKKLQTYLQSLI